jgi:hypothetical protein
MQWPSQQWAINAVQWNEEIWGFPRIGRSAVGVGVTMTRDSPTKLTWSLISFPLYWYHDCIVYRSLCGSIFLFPSVLHSQRLRLVSLFFFYLLVTLLTLYFVL